MKEKKTLLIIYFDNFCVRKYMREPQKSACAKRDKKKKIQESNKTTHTQWIFRCYRGRPGEDS